MLQQAINYLGFLYLQWQVGNPFVAPILFSCLGVAIALIGLACWACSKNARCKLDRMVDLFGTVPDEHK